MEKRNVIEEGRTPDATEKTAETVDAAVERFSACFEEDDGDKEIRRQPETEQNESTVDR